VAASASAIFIDIDFPLNPERIVQIRAKPAIGLFAQTFLTALVNRTVSTRLCQGRASRGKKGNVRNKVNDLKTTLGGKDAAVPAPALTSA
jgi:hypothetical protein